MKLNFITLYNGNTHKQKLEQILITPYICGIFVPLYYSSLSLSIYIYIYILIIGIKNYVYICNKNKI